MDLSYNSGYRQKFPHFPTPHHFTKPTLSVQIQQPRTEPLTQQQNRALPALITHHCFFKSKISLHAKYWFSLDSRNDCSMSYELEESISTGCCMPQQFTVIQFEALFWSPKTKAAALNRKSLSSLVRSIDFFHLWIALVCFIVHNTSLLPSAVCGRITLPAPHTLGGEQQDFPG